MFHLYLAFVVANYAIRDLQTYGKQVLIRSKKRSQWWISKAVWGFFTVTVYYLISDLILLVFAAASGTISLDISSLSIEMMPVDITILPTTELLLGVYLLPFLVSVALTELQLTLELVLKPVYSFASIAILLLASSYLCFPLLIGNSSMTLRNHLIFPNAPSTLFSILYSLALTLFSVLVGVILMRRQDILEKS